MHPSTLCGQHHGVGIDDTKPGDVLCQGACEQFNVLWQVAEVGAYLVSVGAAQVGSVQPHRA